MKNLKSTIDKTVIRANKVSEIRSSNKKNKTEELYEELKDSEIRYRRLFETAKDGILILDFETGNIVDVNPFIVKTIINV